VVLQIRDAERTTDGEEPKLPMIQYFLPKLEPSQKHEPVRDAPSDKVYPPIKQTKASPLVV
jgi:hypothetical protein